MSSIRFFRTFVAVARTGSFAAASERVSLTPAAVGLQMRSLELDLDQVLFDRSGKVVVLSDAGHRLIPRAERLLALYEELRYDTDDPTQFVGSLTVGSISTSMALLTRAVLLMRSSHPKLVVSPSINYSSDLALRVRDQELDAAIAVKSKHKAPAGSQWTPLYKEPFVFVSNRAIDGDAPLQQILDKRLFLKSAMQTDTGSLIQAFMRRENLAVAEHLEMNSLRTMVELVQQGVGVTVVPLPKYSSWESDPGLRVTRFDDLDAHRIIGLFENESRNRLTSVVRRVMVTMLADEESVGPVV